MHQFLTNSITKSEIPCSIITIYFFSIIYCTIYAAATTCDKLEDLTFSFYICFLISILLWPLNFLLILFMIFVYPYITDCFSSFTVYLFEHKLHETIN
ncbi:hypothetical protein ACJX0J_036464, partial [Zea mays]